MQQQIVGIGEGLDLDKLYIVCEGSVVNYSTSEHCGQHCGFALISSKTVDNLQGF